MIFDLCSLSLMVLVPWPFYAFPRPISLSFSVFDDIQSGHSFMDRHIWFCLLFFSGLGLLWNFVGLMVALRNAAMIGGGGTGDGWEGQADTVLGPLGICLWGVLAGQNHHLITKFP